MRFTLKPIAFGVLAVTIQLAGVAYAQAAKAPVALAVRPTPPTTRAPSDQPGGCQSWACLDARSAGLNMNDSYIEQSNGSQPPHR